MADTNTTNLGLLLPDLNDTFNFSSHVEANFTTIDTLMGAIKCTSTTRPSTTYGGQLIYETDSGRLAENTGTKAAPAWTYVSSVIEVCTSTTRPTVGLVGGLTIFESNTGFVRTYTGSAWTDAAMPNCTSSARPANPIAGDLAYETDTNAIIVYNGTAWVYRSLVVCTSSTHPTGAIAAGTLAYETDTGHVAIYSGTAWEVIVQAGAWTTFTPTWTQTGATPAIGSNGTVTASYTRYGRDIHAQYQYVFGSNTNFGTGANPWTFSVPVTAVAPTTNFQAVGSWCATAATTNYGGTVYMTTTGALSLMVNASMFSVHTTNPATWVSTNTLTMDVHYKSAA